MAKAVYIAEKPSEAQELAKALELNTKGREGNHDTDETDIT